MEAIHVTHTFEPVVDEASKILILGSFPSVQSRKNQFYYGHPQNRFWKVLSAVYEDKLPETIEEKQTFLHQNHVAVWDVIASCEIVGSSDSSISQVVANDMKVILHQADIRTIYLNGAKAYDLFQKYCAAPNLPPAVKLPSTSPANAAWRLERLIEDWKIIKMC